jgi:predicted nucleotidyltransferase
MCRLDEIRARRDEVNALARRNRAGRLFVFGSCARKEETPESDIDFLAEFEPGATLFDQARLGLGLQEMFGCKADVIANTALDDPDFGPNVRRDLVAV